MSHGCPVAKVTGARDKCAAFKLQHDLFSSERFVDTHQYINTVTLLTTSELALGQQRILCLVSKYKHKDCPAIAVYQLGMRPRCARVT
jgi:hypothetical protein